MHRREVLKSLAFAATGAGITAASTRSVLAKSTAAKTQRNSYFETVDGTTLFYRDWGTGKPVVFIHSWAANSDMWQYQMIHLTGNGFRCIAYDRRGHGRSADPDHGYEYNTLSDDLAALIDHLNLREVVLVGHSMAGGEIVRYLTRHGASRVARIVLLAPTTPFILKTADNPDGVDKKFLDQIRSAWVKDFPKWLADNTPPFFSPETSPETMQWGIRMALQSSLKALIECNHAVTETDFRVEMRKIMVPTLIIHGDADRSAFIDLTGKQSAKLISGSEFKLYEGAPHGLYITHMDRVDRDLLAFIKGS